MIAVYRSNDEIIIVGLNVDNTPMDVDGTLFGPESGRDTEKFERFDFDADKGQTAHIEPVVGVRIR